MQRWEYAAQRDKPMKEPRMQSSCGAGWAEVVTGGKRSMCRKDAARMSWHCLGSKLRSPRWTQYCLSPTPMCAAGMNSGGSFGTAASWWQRRQRPGMSGRTPGAGTARACDRPGDSRGGGDGVIARLDEGLPIGRKPLIVVIGDAPCADSFRANRGGAVQLLLEATSQRGSAGPDWHGTRRRAVPRCGRQAPAGASKHDTSID